MLFNFFYLEMKFMEWIEMEINLKDNFIRFSNTLLLKKIRNDIIYFQ